MTIANAFEVPCRRSDSIGMRGVSLLEQFTKIFSTILWPVEDRAVLRLGSKKLHFVGIHPVRGLITMYFYHSEIFSKSAYSENKNREALKQGNRLTRGSWVPIEPWGSFGAGSKPNLFFKTLKNLTQMSMV